MLARLGTQAAVRTFIPHRGRSAHEPWQRLVAARVARLDLSPLLAVQPPQGVVPDFLTPPPQTAAPRLRDQLAEIRRHRRRRSHTSSSSAAKQSRTSATAG